jgi:hypothetical protein
MSVLFALKFDQEIKLSGRYQQAALCAWFLDMNC